MMRTAVLLLALAGILAALLRLARALFASLRGGVDSFLARDLAHTRRSRGDLTGLNEASVAAALARRRRLQALGAAAVWAGLLLVPPLTPWPELLYATYALLWVLPRRSERPS